MLSRTEANSTYRDIMDYVQTSGHWEPAKELATRDLFFLLVYILDRRDVDNDWLFERCREVERSPDDHLDLWAR